MKSTKSRYKLISADGVTNVIINKDRILLLKRLPLPMIFNPRAWSFVFGGLEKGEDSLECGYREVREETQIEKRYLKLLEGPIKILCKDEKRKLMWYNDLFIFSSRTAKVTIDFENSGWRWAAFDELKNEKDYTNVFIDEKLILSKIKSCLNGSKKPKKKDK